MAEKDNAAPEIAKSPESAPPEILYEQVPEESEVAESVSTAVTPSFTESVAPVDQEQVCIAFTPSFSSTSPPWPVELTKINIMIEIRPRSIGGLTWAECALLPRNEGLLPETSSRVKTVRLSMATCMYRIRCFAVLKRIDGK